MADTSVFEDIAQDATVRQQVRSQRLVKVPHRTGTWRQRNGAVGTVAFVAGLGWTIDISADAYGLGQNIVQFGAIRGRRIVAAFKNVENTNNSQPTTAYLVDGEVVATPKEGVTFGAMRFNAAPVYQEDEALYELPIDDLEDIDHVVELVVGASTAGTNRRLQYPFRCEERLGYQPPGEQALRTAASTVAVHASTATAAPTLAGPTNYQRALDYATAFELTNPGGAGSSTVIVTSPSGSTWTVAVAVDAVVMVPLTGREVIAGWTFRVNMGGNVAKVSTIGGIY